MNSSIFFSNPSCEKIVTFLKLASRFEYSTKKPGNVGPNTEVKGITVEDYDSVNVKVCDMLSEKCKRQEKIGIGDFALNAVEVMMRTPPRQNLLLGYYLLCAPIYCTAVKLSQSTTNQQKQHTSWKTFWEECKKYIHKSPIQTTIKLSKAIVESKPGGLKTPGGKKLNTDYDLTNTGIEAKILRDHLKIVDFFKESAHFDTISQQITTNYEFVQNMILHWVVPNIKNYNTMERFVQDLFLQILAKKPDSLIYRKNSEQVAISVQEKATEILEAGGYNTSLGKKKIEKLHNKMVKKRGKLNPGTTADLTGAVVFVCFLFRRFPARLFQD